MSNKTTGSIMTATLEETLAGIIANLEEYKEMKYDTYALQVEEGIAESVETLRDDATLWRALPEWSKDRVLVKTEAQKNWLNHSKKWWKRDVARPDDEDMWYIPEDAKAKLITTTRRDAEVLYSKYRDHVEDSAFTGWGRMFITLPCEIIEKCIDNTNRSDYFNVVEHIKNMERAYQLVTGARYDVINVGEDIMQDIADARKMKIL